VTEAQAVTRNHEDVFEDIYESEKWGKGLGSGSGSDPEYCKGYLEYLEQRIPLGAHVLDLGCGDLRMWGDVPLFRRWSYVGADISDTALALAHERFADTQHSYLTKLSAQDVAEVLKVTREEGTTFILLKDVIMHWTDEEILKYLVPLCVNFEGTIITANSWKYWRKPDTPTYPRVLDRHSWAPVAPSHPTLVSLGFKEVGKYARGKKLIMERKGTA
jgi:SAM-dependent methyltransferase